MAKKGIKRNNRYASIYEGGGLLGKFAAWNKNATDDLMNSGVGSALGQLGISGSGLGGAANAAASAVSTLINPSGNNTGVGNALQGIGSMASNIPGIGGVIGAGVNLVGGLTNAMFGSKLNEEFIAQTENKTRQQAGYTSAAKDNTSLLNDWAAYTDMAHVDQDDVGTEGWFSNKAKHKTEALNRAIDAANLRAWHSLSNIASNVDRNNDLLAMANFSAYGGPITMRYTGPMSPFGNTFAEGGGIHIKPENRGKFTALKKRTGKSATWFKEHGTPAQRKMATFALNVRKWKHEDGGPLTDEQYYNIMDRVAHENFKNWGFNSPDEAFIHALNDNTYDYRGYYNKYPNSDANSLTHWTDEFKTVYHPTFSDESRYSGKKSQYNPKGLVGGHWKGDKFIPAEWQKRKRAFGGNLLTNGAEWDNGITIIGNGGTHEENPFEGVQMGVDEQGIPNLVEEGEVIYDDYVFSKRMKVPKDVKKRLKLKGDTFADAAKEISKESNERPNDPISKNGLDSFMSALAESQEEMRMKNENRKANRYAKGGKLGNLFAGTGDSPNTLIPGYLWYDNDGNNTDNRIYSQNYINLNGDGTVNWESTYAPNSGFSRLRNYYINNWDNPSFKPYRDAYLNRLSSNNSNIDLSKFTLDDFKRITSDRKWGYGHELNVNGLENFMNPNPTIQPVDLQIQGKIPTVADIQDDLRRSAEQLQHPQDRRRNNSLSYLRYAPALTSGISSFADIFSSPDFSAADRVDSVDIQPALVSADPIGQYLSYRPLDRMFYINQLNKNATAGRRAIQNTTGGNRAAALAGILAADANYGDNLGKLSRQAEEYNQALRERVAGFNRQTDMFNSQQSLQTQSANQASRNNATQMRLAQAERVAQLRQAARDAYNARRSNNLNNFINNLGNIGWEEAQRDWINNSPWLYYNLSRDNQIGYKGNKQKNGGKLKKKRRNTYA